MKLLLALLLAFPGCDLAAQDLHYPPIDALGWKMTAFTVPDQLTELDTGTVNYLVTLDHKGQVTSLKILNNTFDANAEKLWRAAIKKSGFTRTVRSDSGKKKYRGTMLITRAHCNQPVGTADQLQLFRKRD